VLAATADSQEMFTAFRTLILEAWHLPKTFKVPTKVLKLDFSIVSNRSGSVLSDVQVGVQWSRTNALQTETRPFAASKSNKNSPKNHLIHLKLKISSSSHLVQARFVDRQLVTVPRIDAGLVDVDHDNLDIWTLIGNHSHCWTSNVASANAAYAFDRHLEEVAREVAQEVDQKREVRNQTLVHKSYHLCIEQK
jgi:hypothetical protein